MKNKINLLILAVCFVGCARSHESFKSPAGVQPRMPENSASSPTSPVQGPELEASTERIGWQAISSHVVSSCTACHGASYTSAAGVRANRSKISSVINRNKMPPRRPLGACPKALLKAWIQMGLPDTSQTLVTSLPACASGNIQRVVDDWVSAQPDNLSF